MDQSVGFYIYQKEINNVMVLVKVKQDKDIMKIWKMLIFRTEEFLLLSLCHGLPYTNPLPFASNFFSKTTTSTIFIFCMHVAWVSVYTFCAQQLHQVHTGHTACQNVL
jgi:hypothetical protein